MPIHYKAIILSFFSCLILVCSCSKEDDEGDPVGGEMQLLGARVGTVSLKSNETVEGAPLDQPIVVAFSTPLDTSTVRDNFILTNDAGDIIPLGFSYLDNFKSLYAQFEGALDIASTYHVEINENISGENGATFPGINYSFITSTPLLLLENLTANGTDMLSGNRVQNIDFNFEIDVQFSHEVSLEAFVDNVLITSPGVVVNYEVETQGEDGRSFRIKSTEPSPDLTAHTLRINSGLMSTQGNEFAGYSKKFFTRLDTTPDFPLLSEEELMTLIQEQTFKYFWDFGHPNSGLARERNTSGNTVTSGGSGFGLMAIVVGMERGFISRAEGIERLQKITGFLAQADRFNGVWSHWLNGNTGTAIPFSANDDGADLVETSFLAMGLLTVRQYLDAQVPEEQALIEDINELWLGIEWNWHTRGGQNVLYWHWSPNFGWAQNLPVRGWNESLITYIMAASSPTHGIDAEVYHNGWARNGGMQNGNQYYSIQLPLGPGFGGPLFFEHYTFLGIDPRNLEDQYANYWEQTVNHTLINREHCIVNPQNWVGYGEGCWGLTASDGYDGYSAHSPTNDRGNITPTAALSSFPYTPEYSMEALEHFYYYLGDRLWGEYGLYDAFNPTQGWVAGSYLAIDQGPIIIMIENHRTGLLWDLFMSCPEVQAGLDKLGFTY